MTKRIEDYGLIGNTISAAQVGRDGAIDWLCLPRFDSAACFAALLGGPEHGRWLIAATDTSSRTARRYSPDTAVIETHFETQDGAVTVTDFMPFTQDEERVDGVRIVRGVRGRVRMSTELRAIGTTVGHFVRNDQVILGLDCHLHVVADGNCRKADNVGAQREPTWRSC